MDQASEIASLKAEVARLREELQQKENALQQKEAMLFTVLQEGRMATRALERAIEKLEITENVTAATKRRQLMEKSFKSDSMRQLSTKMSRTNKTLTTSVTDHAKKLLEAHEKLVSMMDAPAVAAEMFQNDALTLRELESIQECTGGRAASADKLLSIVRPQPYAIYHCFMTALRRTEQEELFLLLAYKGTFQLLR